MSRGAASHDATERADGLDPEAIMEFFDDIPHWAAQAGLSSEGAASVADALEELVEAVQRAGYPAVDVDGPDPDSFPPPSNRIAAAGTQLLGLTRGLDDEGWVAEVGDGTVLDRCRTAISRVRSHATS